MMTGTPMNSKVLMLMLVGPSFVGGSTVPPIYAEGLREGDAERDASAKKRTKATDRQTSETLERG